MNNSNDTNLSGGLISIYRKYKTGTTKTKRERGQTLHGEMHAVSYFMSLQVYVYSTFDVKLNKYYLIQIYGSVVG
jgi:hypothetical protein